ncbi:GNAT family N-acetyltransferase [Cellulomonas sp. JZ18]|uniref:GNAT family N-acetyltransferase n=1 Tax=Cellulomonas sp. JZ18 TaxID=2654191 RepID=UPI0012D47351|nr:GNAT family N-acetyltransferase [Cellulomonas sp. JZ18]QGQ18166.1 GNAT family N-acetyltransferase [Cellulomonas sp. JZ18]
MSDVVVSEVPDERRFEARTPEGELLGFAAYHVEGDDVVLTHTEVDPRAEGHGIGSSLVRQTLDQLSASGRGVVAVCPFVRSWVDAHPDYAGVLKRR